MQTTNEILEDSQLEKQANENLLIESPLIEIPLNEAAEIENGIDAENVEVKAVETALNKQVALTKEIEQKHPVNVLHHMEIKAVTIEGLKPFKAALNGDSILVDADTFFTALFCDKSTIHAKYVHIAAVEKKGIDAIEGKDKYFAIEKINERILEFVIQKSTYEKSPEKYSDFVQFVNAGGCNAIASFFGLDSSYKARELDFIANSQPKESVQQQQPKEQEKSETAMLLDALESIKNNSDSNFKNIAIAIEAQSNKQQATDKALAGLYAEIQSVKSKAYMPQPQQAPTSNDGLRDKLTNKRIWLRIAILVTVVFLPFTSAGLYKYINLYEGESGFAYFLIGVLCVAIAAIWDFSILLFSINGKRWEAFCGSLVQFAFMSAKFDFVKIVLNDLSSLDGDWWQKMIVVFCAVAYTPFLLANVGDLASKQLNENKEVHNDEV